MIVSHPIQHFCPQYVSFAKNASLNFKVFFASALGYKKYHDLNFNKEINWTNLRLDQFNHEFLNGEEVIEPDKKLDASNVELKLEEFQPDAVIIYGYFQKIQRRVSRWSKKNKVLIFYISDTERRQKRNLLKELIKYPLIRFFFSDINYALTVGDANEDYYKYVGLKKSQMIRMYFPIDIELYVDSYKRKEELKLSIRKRYNIRLNEFVIMVVGKLVPWKNQIDIIKALKLLENELYPIHTFIIGSGNMQEIWEGKTKQLNVKNVHFTGFINADELPGYYAAADLYIHPASVEPHSLAISESIYMGCPVIISDRCGSYGNNDDVQDGQNGLVYNFGDLEELAQKIKWMIGHPLERKLFSERSHQIANNHQYIAHYDVVNSMIAKIK